MVVAVISAGILALLSIVALVVPYIFAESIAHPKVLDPEATMERYRKIGFSDPLSVLKGYRQEDFTYHSELGYDLRGKIVRSNANDIPNSEPRKQRIVILCHGFTGNYMSMLPYVKVYLALGFNVVMYDHRGHGTSDKTEGTFCSMGLYEAQDLIGLASFVRQSFPQDSIWGLHGESMGAATVMQAGPDIPGLSFIVEDCGFSSMRAQMQNTLRSMHLPAFPFLLLGDLKLKRKYGIDMDKVNASESVARINVPMLFIHGDSDTLVPTDMVNDVFKAKKDSKQLQLFEGSDHAMSIIEHPQQYVTLLSSFFRQFGIC